MRVIVTLMIIDHVRDENILEEDNIIVMYGGCYMCMDLKSCLGVRCCIGAP